MLHILLWLPAKQTPAFLRGAVHSLGGPSMEDSASTMEPKQGRQQKHEARLVGHTASSQA